MPRPARMEYPNATYYVTARARRGESLFRDDADYWRFTAWLGAVCTRYGWRCHAYSLVPMRYALILHTRDANLARGMRQLNGVYSQSFNRRHLLCGPIFLGRYTAQPFDRARNLLQVARHVMHAPIFAGLCKDPAQWRWSSYRATLESATLGDWLVTSPIWEACAGLGATIRDGFIRYMATLDLRPAWPTLKLPASGSATDTIAQCYAASLASQSAIPRLTDVVALADDPKLAMRTAYATGHFSLKQIAAHFGVHYSTVSRTVGSTPMNVGGAH